MRYKRRLLISLLIAFAMLISGCGGSTGASTDTADTEASKTAEEAELEDEEVALEEERASEDGDGKEEGREIPGYTLLSAEENDILQSTLLTYKHDKSGASVVCIDNDDQELAFGIFYRTPVVDETDTNHVFEHAILASSEKYPSHDLFFDIANKSYNTFINAFTYDTFTGYPLSSMNEDQLIKMMDAYLSCMVAPDILTDENIFKREAIRYELTDPEADIKLTGTVYAEDFGSLTNTESEAFNNIRDALYPGETSSNLIGRAHMNYKELTYEHTIETYERCYSFDNSLILLYGDMDFARVLGFADEEYLSKAEKKGTDLSEYLEQETEPGFVEAVVESPAYEGDLAENVSIIDYAISLSDLDWEELLGLDVLSYALMKENSSFVKELRAAGIQNDFAFGIDHFTQKPYFMFRLKNADESQAAAFKEAVDRALTRLSENGMEQDILDSVLKQIEISNHLVRDTQNAGIDIFPNIVNYWTHTGETDYYGLYEEVVTGLLEDEDQSRIKELSKRLLESERSALVATVPTPGLAEEIIAERDQYLADMKAAMSEEEIEELIADTEAFNEWNSISRSNSDFIIDPSELEDFTVPGKYERTVEEGITYYEAEASVDKVGRFALYLDASALDEEDLHYLNLYTLLMTMLPTEQHTDSELMNLVNEYLVGFSAKAVYPDGTKAKDPYPMIRFDWTGLTEDHEDSLSLLIELLTETKLDDGAAIYDIVDRYMDSFDLSRNAEFLYLAKDTAASAKLKSKAYERLFGDQDFYYFLRDVRDGLASDEFYAGALSDRLSKVREKLVTSHGLIYVCAASDEELSDLKDEAKAILSGLPKGEDVSPQLSFGEVEKRIGIAVESPDQYTASNGDMFESKDLLGRYLPYLTALSDKYITPVIRFQNGAYSGSVNFNTVNGSVILYSYSDPNVGVTIDVFDDAAEYMRSMELTEEDLDGYILNAFGTVNLNTGVLKSSMDAVERDIRDYDMERAAEVINDIKNASLSDQDKASEVWAEVLGNANICTVGNEGAIRSDAEYFDEIISYKAGALE